MREEFCTITDLQHLPQVLVLTRSLARTAARFRLRVLCMDEASEACLRKLDPPGVEILRLANLERADPGLAAVRSARSHREYCWTAKSALCSWVLDAEPDLPGITFLDADLMFFGDPGILYEELGAGSVLLVRNLHGYRADMLRLSPPPFDSEEWGNEAPLERRLRWVFGPFNAGTVAFRNDERGRGALGWWRERSIERCSSHFDGGSWAEQRYLWNLQEKFEGVHVLAHLGGGMSPGGTGRHALSQEGQTVLIDGQPLVVFHYESLAIHRHGRLSRLLGGRRIGVKASPVCVRIADYYRVGTDECRLIWRPYLADLARAIDDVARLEPAYLPSLEPLRARDRLRYQAQLTRLAAFRFAARSLPLGPRRKLSALRRGLP